MLYFIVMLPYRPDQSGWRYEATPNILGAYSLNNIIDLLGIELMRFFVPQNDKVRGNKHALRMF